MTEPETIIATALERKWHITSDQTQLGQQAVMLCKHTYKHSRIEKQMYIFNILVMQNYRYTQR